MLNQSFDSSTQLVVNTLSSLLSQPNPNQSALSIIPPHIDSYKMCNPWEPFANLTLTLFGALFIWHSLCESYHHPHGFLRSFVRKKDNAEATPIISNNNDRVKINL